jgi:hypothetical protein
MTSRSSEWLASTIRFRHRSVITYKSININSIVQNHLIDIIPISRIYSNRLVIKSGAPGSEMQDKLFADSDDDLLEKVQLSPRFSWVQSPPMFPRQEETDPLEETIGSLRDAYLDESMTGKSFTPVMKPLPEKKKSEKVLSTVHSESSFVGIENLLENNRKWAENMVSNNPNFFTKLVKQHTPQVLWIGW